MIISAGSYASSLKEKGYNRDYLKKKKSQEAFYVKAKLSSQLGEHIKPLHLRKPQPRGSSLAYIKEERRVGSLEMPFSDISVLESMGPAKPSAGRQKNIGHCWSERNVSVVSDPSKLQKYRKFSSNAELGEEQLRPDSQRRKLSLVDYPNEPTARKVERLSLMAWLILLRKLFVEEFKKRSSRAIKPSILYSYIQKLDSEGLDEFSLVVEPLEYEVDLSKAQIVTILESYFAASNRRARQGKADSQAKVSFCDVTNCLVQFQSKNSNLQKPNPKSTSSEEEAVETARFQEGGEELKKRKLS
jgi:hypothetical protein